MTLTNLERVAIIATPRTGSTYLKFLLENYLKIEDHCVNEYFNVKTNKLYITDNVIHQYRHLNNFSSDNDKEKKKEAIRRLRLLKIAKNPLVIKILHNQIRNYDDKIMNEIMHNFKFVWLDRKSKYEQLLSWEIAAKTGIYFINNNNIDVMSNIIDKNYKFNKKKNIEPFAITKDSFNGFVNCITSYEKFKKKYFNVNLDLQLYYEDLPKFRKKYRIPDYNSVKLYSFKEKEHLISNLKEVKEWFSYVSL